MADVGRNSPCPCGSGRRYKDCHGLLTTEAQNGAETTRQRLNDALDAQKRGRFADALALYQSVVNEQPGNFDALHMLGVVRYQRGEFDLARRYVRDALLLKPFDAAARKNLELIESTLERRAVEREICRDMLPRVGARCVEPTPAPRPPAGGTRARTLSFSVRTPLPLSPRSNEIGRWTGAADVNVWLTPRTPRADLPPSWRTIDPASHALPRAARTIYFGADRSPAAWLDSSPAREVALYCRDESPCVLVDRITELARDGHAPIRLLFASALAAKRIGLPGAVVRAA